MPEELRATFLNGTGDKLTFGFAVKTDSGTSRFPEAEVVLALLGFGLITALGGFRRRRS